MTSHHVSVKHNTSIDIGCANNGLIIPIVLQLGVTCSRGAEKWRRDRPQVFYIYCLIYCFTAGGYLFPWGGEVVTRQTTGVLYLLSYLLFYSWGLPVPVGRRSGDEKSVLAESPSSPKDAPWCQNVAAEQGKASGGSKAVRFSDIVLDELQQNETLVRTTNKPLALIQVSLVTSSCFS